MVEEATLKLIPTDYSSDPFTRLGRPALKRLAIAAIRRDRPAGSFKALPTAIVPKSNSYIPVKDQAGVVNRSPPRKVQKLCCECRAKVADEISGSSDFSGV